MTNFPRPVSVLTIAGSDSGGGAGIQADLKTFAAHRVHGLSAIAALTAQHTRGVNAVEVPAPAFVRAQIDACFDDFDIGAVKIGMLANSDMIRAVAEALDHHRPRCIVVDPVMIATSGDRLLAADAVDVLRQRLLPMATLITPNLPEAELLLGRAIDDLDAMRQACDALLDLGPGAVLLKGGHLGESDKNDGANIQGDAVEHGEVERSEVVDLFSERRGNGERMRRDIRHPRLALNAHGTGCTLAAAVAAQLALGASLADACDAASDYVHRALRLGSRPGRSDVLVLDHFGAAERV